MAVTDKYAKFSEEFLSFKNYKNNGLNSIAIYPAMMIDEMQKSILQEVVLDFNKLDKITVLDPFCGSGTSLIMAKELGLNQIGIDINPLAILISKVKLETYNKQIFRDTKKLIKLLDSTQVYTIHYFDKIDKWFRQDIIDSLSKIRFCIMNINTKKSRLFFWVIFSNIVRQYSNSRLTTFKLHIKDESSIQNLNNNCINDFKKELLDSINKLCYDKTNKTNKKLYCGDTLEYLEKIKDNSIQIVCTSPPYGDNATTVTYGQFSSLSLRWINRSDLADNIDSIDYSYSSIDSLSLGGKKKNNVKNISSLNKYLIGIRYNKRQKVINFINDYYSFFNKISKKIINDGYIILTVANRRVDNNELPFVEINDELASLFGFEKVTEKQRKILNKRMASKISNVNSESVQSMTKEYVLIYQKKGE